MTSPKKSNLAHLALTVTLVVLMSLFYLTYKHKPPKKPLTFNVEVSQATLKNYNKKGLCTSIINAAHATEYPEKKQWKLTNPTLKIIDQGQVNWVIQSEQALYSTQKQLVTLLGPSNLKQINKNKQSLILQGTHFILDLKHHHGYSKSPVTLITNNSTLLSEKVSFSWHNHSQKINMGPATVQITPPKKDHSHQKR
jgi:LPS export ABC transporter protein LptC